LEVKGGGEQKQEYAEPLRSEIDEHGDGGCVYEQKLQRADLLSLEERHHQADIT
jgi:hypothetical protein